MSKRETVNAADFNVPEKNPLLRERMKKHGLRGISFQPIFNDVVVWRLPNFAQTSGGLYIPDDAKVPHSKGLLLKCGPMAMDTLFSNGIFPGHYVLFEKFSGWELHDQSARQQAAQDSDAQEILILKDRMVKGSDDLAEALESGKAKYELGPDGRYVLNCTNLLTGRVQKLLALAESTDNPHEAAVAQRRAHEMKE